MKRIGLLAALVLAACGGAGEGTADERHAALGRCFTPPRDLVGGDYTGANLCVPEEWEPDLACMRLRSTVECSEPETQALFCVVVHASQPDEVSDEGEVFGRCISGAMDCIGFALDNPPCCEAFYATHDAGQPGDCE